MDVRRRVFKASLLPKGACMAHSTGANHDGHSLRDGRRVGLFNIVATWFGGWCCDGNKRSLRRDAPMQTALRLAGGLG